MIIDNVRFFRILNKICNLIVYRAIGVNMPSVFHYRSRPVIDHSVRITGAKNIYLGSRIHLYPYCYLKSCPGKIVISDNASIGEFSYINSMESVFIGRDVLIAPSCHITDANHDIGGVAVIAKNRRVSRPVTIKDGCWIGAGAKVLSGVTIGCGAVIGAGAVVTGDIPDYAVAVGIPCKVLRYREGF